MDYMIAARSKEVFAQSLNVFQLAKIRELDKLETELDFYIFD